jgi:hypothetical protein
MSEETERWWKNFEIDWTQEHHWPYDEPLSWNWHDDEWIAFDYASYQIHRHLDLSIGRAQQTLRELCASGDVRAIQYEFDEVNERNGEPYHVRPSAWLKGEIDLQEGRRVEVSEYDVRHWLDKQKPTEEPARAEGRTSKKRELACQAIEALWPEGIPEIPNGEIEKQVGNWITSYCKQNNTRRLEISPDTILRAAGRK